MSAVPSDLVGLVVGDRYELLELLGQGGQGVVYRGNDRRSNQAVAVKMLSQHAARDPQATARFEREQQALQRLEGSAAVRVLDTCQEPALGLCLVMELLDGKDLDAHLRELEAGGGRLSLDELRRIFDPVVATLELAHARGILHRDLKPANVFLLNTGGVRLLDFGFARLRGSAPLTGAGIVMGSPSYIAPEVWQGKKSEDLDQRVDVYALGVLLYRALASAPPFLADSLAQMLVLATTAPRPSLHRARPDLPAAVDAWKERALAIDPDRRFGSARELYADLLRVTTRRSTGGFGQALRRAASALRRWTTGEMPAAPAPAPPRPQPVVAPRARPRPGTVTIIGRAMAAPPSADPPLLPSTGGRANAGASLDRGAAAPLPVRLAPVEEQRAALPTKPPRKRSGVTELLIESDYRLGATEPALDGAAPDGAEGKLEPPAEDAGAGAAPRRP